MVSVFCSDTKQKLNLTCWLLKLFRTVASPLYQYQCGRQVSFWFLLWKPNSNKTKRFQCLPCHNYYYYSQLYCIRIRELWYRSYGIKFGIIKFESNYSPCIDSGVSAISSISWRSFITPLIRLLILSCSSFMQINHF